MLQDTLAGSVFQGTQHGQDGCALQDASKNVLVHCVLQDEL